MKKHSLLAMAVITLVMGCKSGTDKPIPWTPPPPSTPSAKQATNLAPIEYFSNLIELYRARQNKAEADLEISQNPALLNQCAVELCGPSTKYAPLRSLAPFTPEQAATNDIFYQQNEIDKKLDAFISASLARSEIIGNKLLGLYEAKKAASLNLFIRNVMTVMSLMNSVSERGYQVLDFSDEGDIFVPEDRYSLAFPTLSSEKAFAAGKLINKFLRSPDFKSALFIADRSFDHYLRNLNKTLIEQGTTKNIDQSMTYIFDFYRPRIRRLTNLFGPLIFHNHDLSLLNKQLATDLSDLDKKALMGLFYTVNVITATLKQDIRNDALDLKLSLEECAEMSRLPERLLAIQNTINLPNHWLAEKERVADKCKVSIGKRLATAPTAIQQQEAAILGKEVREAAKKTAQRYFTGESLELATLALEQVKILPPQDLDKTKRAIIETIESNTRRILEVNEQRQAIVNGQGRWDTLLMVTMLAAGSETDRSSVLKNVEEVCSTFSPPFFTDTASYDTRTVTISWQSIFYPQIGAGVLAHELGHIVSDATASFIEGKASYYRVREKSADLHSLLERGESPTSHSYKEEDWADAFAQATLSTMNRNSPSHNNFACALIDVKPGSSDYQNLSFSSVDSSEHSTPLLRALLSAISQKAPIPESCDKALRQQIGPAQ